MAWKPKKLPKLQLIDDSDFLIQRVVEHEAKPSETIESRIHGSWICTLACHHCGRSRPVVDVEGAHLRKGAGHPKGAGKKDDFWKWPGCFRCHEQIQHVIGEDRFWEGLLNDFDRWRTVLTKYGMQSPDTKVRDAATAEFERRYGRAA